ncbi:hypothetical protein F4561_000682 [Lipingzhangella halophila]|uniref:Uncharacterized protein n=1 Tax=Lipingzhangella halophila TaxID=1783352 RepID=A0A7W7W0F7_9ACTN|nr:hypothetical protein [Lipingzhangella halophila]MBB4929862.1 hypothetical protein [Lipingzhangella halophila]
MPREPRRVSAFFKILILLTAACGILVGGGYALMTSIEPIEVEEEEPTEECVAAIGENTRSLAPEQAANAATINGVAFRRNLPQQSVVIAYATVWQESKFYNIDYGDRDSLGLFQQRPSQDWGDPEDLLDPVYTSDAFYQKLEEVSGYEDMPVYEAAQVVQRSADGFAYDQHEEVSRNMAQAFGGTNGAAVTCRFTEGVGERSPDIDGAQEEMRRVFGLGVNDLPVAEEPQTGDLGWAMAQWAVAQAPEYGLNSVTYGDQRWSADSDKEGWTSVDNPAPEGRIVLD